MALALRVVVPADEPARPASVAVTGTTGAVILRLPEAPLLDFLLAIPLVLILGGPAGEELVFRAYAQHELQTEISPLATAPIIGAGVVIWHVPLIALGYLGWPMMICTVAVSRSSTPGSTRRAAASGRWWRCTSRSTISGPEYIGSMVAEPDGQFVYRLFFLPFYLPGPAGSSGSADRT